MSDNESPMTPDLPVIDYSGGAPAGAPRKWRFTPVWPIVLAGATGVFMVGGGMVSVLSVVCTPISGATRSTRFMLENRTTQIEQDLNPPAREAHHE